MNSVRTRSLRLGMMAAAAVAAISLVGCNQPGEPTVGQKVDGAIAEAKQTTNEVAKDVKQAGAEAADAMKSGAMDATITTKVNAALAADDKLSALKINVDTANGRVTLSGSAPDAASRDRATTLASAVDGVSAVDNRLSVGGS